MKYFILALFFLPYLGYSQNTEASVWVQSSIGLHYNQFPDEANLTYGAKLFVNHDYRLMAIHYSIGELPIANSNHQTFSEVAFLGGWITKGSNNHFYILTGISFFNGLAEGESINKENESSTGWPLEFGYTHYINNNLGFSVSYFGNYNNQSYFDGLRLGFTIGQFRGH